MSTDVLRGLHSHAPGSDRGYVVIGTR